MSRNLETETASKIVWSRADSERIAGTRPHLHQFTPGTVFENGALTPLEGTAKLSFVQVENSDLTRANLLALANLPAVYRLNLKGCRFDSRDFADFCQRLAQGDSPKLTELWLENTAIGDDDLPAVGAIVRLRWLILSGTRITNAGLPYLHSLRKLETLWLERTAVTDQGVLGLAVLPRLDGLPTRGTACSPDIAVQVLHAQTVLQTSRAPLNKEQADTADVRLRAFLNAMDAWERAVWKRAKEIEAEFQAQRPEPFVFSEAESAANRAFLREINDQKAAIAARFCSRKLIERGAGSTNSYSSEPRFKTQDGDWIAVETPSRNKTIFIGPGAYNGKRRYLLKWEADEWKLDEVQWWNGGWKRDYV